MTKCRLLILAIAAGLVISGCGPRYTVIVSGPQGISAPADMAIHELVVRNLVVKEPPREVIFVSFGASRLDNVDPPQAFFERLADVPAT